MWLDRSEATVRLWRNWCEIGLPRSVQDSLDGVVGLSVMTDWLWSEVFQHHVRGDRENSERKTKQQTKRLLKHQKEENESKKKYNKHWLLHWLHSLSMNHSYEDNNQVQAQAQHLHQCGILEEDALEGNTSQKCMKDSKEDLKWTELFALPVEWEDIGGMNARTNIQYLTNIWTTTTDSRLW